MRRCRLREPSEEIPSSSAAATDVDEAALAAVLDACADLSINLLSLKPEVPHECRCMATNRCLDVDHKHSVSPDNLAG